MFRANPIYRKEARTSERTMKNTVMLLAVNGVLSIIAFMMFYGTMTGSKGSIALDYSGLVDLYTTISYIEFCIVALVVPAITAGAICGEKERRTLDIMLSGRISAFSIVFGKLLACLRFISIAVISSLPVFSIVFAYGGIRFANIIELLIAILVTGFYLGGIGILCSSICKRTTTAVVASYACMIGTILIPCGIVYAVGKLGTGTLFPEKLEDNLFYFMLLNPATTVIELISKQLDTVNEFNRFFFGNAPQNTDIMESWTRYSLLVQASVSILCIVFAALVLDPLRFNFIRRFTGKHEKKSDRTD